MMLSRCKNFYVLVKIDVRSMFFNLYKISFCCYVFIKYFSVNKMFVKSFNELFSAFRRFEWCFRYSSCFITFTVIRINSVQFFV